MIGYFYKGAWVEPDTAPASAPQEPEPHYRSWSFSTGFSRTTISESPYCEKNQGITFKDGPLRDAIIVPVPGFRNGAWCDYFMVTKNYYEASIDAVIKSVNEENRKMQDNFPDIKVPYVPKVIQSSIFSEYTNANPWSNLIPENPIQAMKGALKRLPSSHWDQPRSGNILRDIEEALKMFEKEPPRMPLYVEMMMGYYPW